MLLTCGSYGNVIRWIPPLIVTQGQMDEALAMFRDRAVECSLRISHCDPRVGILESAAGDGAGLIVIGKRGAGQFSGLGGTASYLVRHSPLPLAVVP